MSFRLLSLILLVSFVAGCSKYMPKLDEVLPDKRTEYKKSKSLPDLEVPPDLTTEGIDDTMAVPSVDEEGTATFSTYKERVRDQKVNGKYTRTYRGSGEAFAEEDVSGEQLLIVEGSPSTVWPQLESFWASEGYSLDLNDDELGIMVTAWEVHDGTGNRNKFKVLVEPAAEKGKTAVYLTHIAEGNDQNTWADDSSDDSLRKGMAIRLENTLGGSVDTSSTSSSAATTYPADPALASSQTPESDSATQAGSELLSAGDGKMYLTVQQDFATTWEMVGTALHRVSDIEIDDEEQAKGVYEITYETDVSDKKEKKGLLSKLTFWKGDDEYQVSLTGVGNKTEVVVLDADGEWETSAAAEEILTRIQTELN